MSAVEVILFDPSGSVAARAECEPDAAVFCGATLWDDASAALPLIQGASMKRWSVGYYVDAKLVRIVEGRP